MPPRTKSKPRKSKKVNRSKQPKDSKASSPLSKDDETDLGDGFCFETSERFNPPPTSNTIALLMKPWIPASSITITLMGLLLWYGLSIRVIHSHVDPYFPGTSTWLASKGAGSLTDSQVLLIAIFWRLMYNVALGLVLRLQSDTKFLTHFIMRVQKRGTSFWYNLVNVLVAGTAGCSDSLQAYPAGFNAWLLNMQFVNIILPLDVMAFMIVVFRQVDKPSDCFSIFLSSDTTASLIAETPGWLCSGASYTAMGIGMLLGLVSVMGKRAAFDVIGHYAWFWGDFFYGLDLELKFDGIFDLAPHPMYTVGYGWMYGLALMTGSSHVAALAFGSHFLQIFFLVAVEDPHIHKLYGPAVVTTPSSKILTSSQSNSNVLLIGNFDIYRSSDWQLVSICSLLIIVFVMGSTRVGNDNVQILSDSVVLGTALLARVIGTSIQAFILRQQVKSRFWTNHFVQRGQTVDKAFTEWKRLSNAMDTLMNLCFYMAAYRFFSPNDYWLLSESHGNATVATLIFGVLALLGIALWAERSVFQALGAEGWFYGDFFIPPTKEMKERALVYQGIYRYVNNPDVLLGKLWLYGTALATLRVEMTVLAGLSHGVAWLFLIVVEEPHMESFYDKDNIRKHSSALTKKIKTQLLPKIAASARAMFYRQHSWKR